MSKKKEKIKLNLGAIIGFLNGDEFTEFEILVDISDIHGDTHDGHWKSTNLNEDSARGRTTVELNEKGRILDYYNGEYYLISNGISDRTFCS